MSEIDPYSYCPGGTGKKIKFCCSELVGELGRIQDMLDGGQRAACLEFIETLEKKYPERACLVTTRALLQSALGSNDKAAETIEHFLEKNPNNPVALAEQALVSAVKHGPLAGIQPLQKSLENSGNLISGRVAGSVGRLGEMLLMKGNIAAARGHFILAYRLNPQDQDTLQMLARILASPGLPLVVKNEQMLVDAPEGAPWKSEFDAAVTDAARGLWWRAADKLRDISQKAPDARAVWQNLAVLRSWLADRTGAVAALRKLSGLVEWEDAVEAEAQAQIYDGAEERDVIDELRTMFDIKDNDRATEALVASKLAAAFNWESLEIDFGDQPTPRAAYYLIDRPIPAAAADIQRADIPQIVGKLLVYGRQTDREARIELFCSRPELDAAKRILTEIVGDAIAAPGEPEKVDETPKAEKALSWSWRLPESVPPLHVQQLIEAQRRESVLESWPNTPFARFGGKTPLEAVGDPQYRLAVAAAVMLLEQSFPQASAGAVFVELRTKLGLPQPQTPDPAKVGPAMPYSRLHLLDAAKLSDEDLVKYLNRALQVVARQAVRNLGKEVVTRASLKGKIDVASVYGHLADLEAPGDEALAYIDLARKAAEEQKQSSATWDLEEMELRLRRGEGEHFFRLAQHIEQQHIREPGVGQALMEIMYSAGLVGPDGRLRMPAGAGQAAATAPAEAAGKLWTPDSPAAAAPAGAATKSGLWVPGMD